MMEWMLRFSFILYIFCLTKGSTGYDESWDMQEQCGRTLEAYGGTIDFDASRLRRGFCQVKIIGRGAEDTMLSIFFTSFNISSVSCLENITMEETGMAHEYKTAYSSQGLFQSFCKNTGYLNENSLYTTDRNKLLLKYSSSQKVVAMDMKFTIKFTAFTSRVRGCREEELASDMFSCPSGRCVHKSLLCGDLNPCGDNRDCNITSGVAEQHGEDKGLHYVKFVVITVVVVFAVFALIQVTLIVRNEHTLCSRKAAASKGGRLEAELMPMANGHAERMQQGSVIEVQTS